MLLSPRRLAPAVPLMCSFIILSSLLSKENPNIFICQLQMLFSPQLQLSCSLFFFPRFPLLWTVEPKNLNSCVILAPTPRSSSTDDFEFVNLLSKTVCQTQYITYWYGSPHRGFEQRKGQRETVSEPLWWHSPGIWVASDPLCSWVDQMYLHKIRKTKSNSSFQNTWHVKKRAS